MTLVDCYPIGILYMTDDNQKDEKIIAVPVNDPSYSCYHDISEIPPHIFDEISHFFEVYKVLENKHTAIKEIANRDEAIKCIEACLKRYEKKFVK